MFMLFVHCLWVYKERTDMNEQVYRLGRSPWRHKGVGFGEGRAARAAPSLGSR